MHICKMVFTALFVFSFIAPAEAVLSSNVTAVTVYPREARVTRSVEVTLSAGAEKITIDALPVNLNDASLRIEVTGPEGIKFYGHELRTAFGVEPSDEDVKRLREKFEALGDQISGLERRKALASENIEFLRSIKAATAEQVGKALVTEAPVTAETLAVYDFRAQKAEENYAAMESVDRDIRTLEKERTKIKKELERLRSQTSPDSKQVDIRVEAARAGNATIEVSYLMHGAWWQPVYDVRSSEDLKTVEISYYGKVIQNTGEDWTDVALSLSTAKPQLGAAMPKLDPWYVGKREPEARAREMQYQDAYAPTALKAPADFFGEEEIVEKKPGRAGIAESTVVEHGTHVTYDIPQSASIPSDGEPHQLPISIESFPLKIEYVTTPRLAPTVYIRSQIKNTSAATFLAGQAFIFRGNDFIGSGYIKETPPAEEIKDLFLGPDERIRATFDTLKEFTNDNLLLGSYVAKERKCKIDLKNLKSEAATVEVWDHHPVSRDQDIKVERFDVAPDAATDLKDEEASRGFMKWIVPVPASGEKSITFGFRVKYKKGTEIYGI